VTRLAILLLAALWSTPAAAQVYPQTAQSIAPAYEGWEQNDDGSFKEDHTHWKGFQNRTAKGLRYEVLKAAE